MKHPVVLFACFVSQTLGRSVWPAILGSYCMINYGWVIVSSKIHWDWLWKNFYILLYYVLDCILKFVPSDIQGSKQPSPSPSSKEWDTDKSKWVFSPSPLSSYVCWKCSKVGHLPKDCTVAVKEGGKRKGQKESVSLILSLSLSLSPPSLSLPYSWIPFICWYNYVHTINCFVHSIDFLVS